jgi:hypothetical protein
MNCRYVQEQLSAFHDGELSESVAAQVASHVAACPDCSEQLRVFRELSRLSATLRTPVASNAWEALSAELAKTASISEALTRFRIPRLHSKWAVAAGLLLVCGAVALVLAFQSRHSHNMAEAFDHFLVEFAKSPSRAEAVLSAMYEGQPVTATEAERLLKYRPAIYRGLPPDYSLNSAYVMKMPCCTCFQANLGSKDGVSIAVFEHDGEQDEWFGNRPSTEVLCQGMPTRLVQIDSYLAASCPCGPRYVTIVGAKDVEEVERLLTYWMPEKSP